MIGVFSPLLNPDRQTNPDLIVGAQIGAEQFVTAMMQHLPDETVGLLVPEAGLQTAGQDTARLLQNHNGKSSTVRICGMSSMPQMLNDAPPLVLHDATGPFLHRSAYLRARFATRNFPATCLVHGLSYAGALWDFYTRLLLTPTLPCDAVICTSRAAQDAFANLLTRAEETLRVETRSSAFGAVRRSGYAGDVFVSRSAYRQPGTSAGDGTAGA